MAAFAAQGHVHMVHLERFGEFAAMEDAFFGDFDIEDFAAGFAVEMPVFAHVRAEAHGGAVENDLADEAAFDEDAQAVVNGGEGNFGAGLAGALEDLLGGGVVVAVGQDIEHLLALPRHAQPAGGQAAGKALMFFLRHGSSEALE